jgi:chromosome segregation ATPase
MAEINGLNAVKTDVEILKKDVSNIQGLLGKVDVAIDKIADATNGISQILAVHQSKIDGTAEDIGALAKASERSDELLHQRIKEKDQEHKDLANDNHEALMDFLKDHDERSGVSLDEIYTRIRVLEQWKWVIVGGAAAILYLLSESNILEQIG